MITIFRNEKQIGRECLMDYCYGWNIIFTIILFVISYLLNLIGLNVTKNPIALTFPLWIPFILFIAANAFTFILASIMAFFFIIYFTIMDYMSIIIDGFKDGWERAKKK